MNNNRSQSMCQSISQKRRRASRQSGFTLLEMLLAVSLSSLLILGAMDLLIASSRATVRTQAQVYATGDAANSIQQVIALVREASAFTLPTSGVQNTAEAGWNTPTGTTLGLFSTTLNTVPINTAIEITAPPTLIPADNGYRANVKTIQVQNVAGANYWSITPYNTQGTGTAVTLIYRGDPDGTPDPDPTGSTVTGAGTYLWNYAVPLDNSFTLDIADPNPLLRNPVALCKSISTAPDAVQFVRPVYNTQPVQNQVEVKIISGYYSPINGTQTNEEGNGASSSQLTGKCVYMRDHNTSGTPANSSTRNSNNAFQYH